MELLRLQQDLPAIYAKGSLALSELFCISSLYFSVLPFLEDYISLNRDALSCLWPSWERADKPCTLRKWLQNSDSGRPSRAKQIPLDLPHSAESFVCPRYPVSSVLVSCLGCAGWLPWVTQMVRLFTDPGSKKRSVALELMSCAGLSVNFFQTISDTVGTNGYVDFYSPW